MSSPLTYSDQVPTVPGWYWRRDNQGAQVLYVSLSHHVPAPWRVIRAHTLALITAEDRKALEALPESAWLIEWAGPIPSPEEPETQEQREDRKIIERAQDLAEYLYGSKE